MSVRIGVALIALLLAAPAAAEEATPPAPAVKPAPPKPPAPKPKPKAPPAPPAPAPPPATFDVVDQETRLWRAMTDGDQAAIGAMLADDVVLVGRNGVRGKAELLASLAACRLSEAQISDTRVRPLTVDVIALAYRVRYRASCAGEPIPADLNETSVWMRQGPAWRLMLHTETATPAAP